MSEIINRVSKSSIVTLNLEEIYPQEPRLLFDIKPFLFQELILREKEFRAALKEVDWSLYEGNWVAIDCSVDAILPNWSFLLVATYLNPIARGVVVGDLDALEKDISDTCIDGLNVEDFRNRPVVVKGCSDLPIPLYAYGKVISLIQPVAKSIMYGEPCSTVPLYKKPKD